LKVANTKHKDARKRPNNPPRVSLPMRLCYTKCR
jgi:hypothetical protein